MFVSSNTLLRTLSYANYLDKEKTKPQAAYITNKANSTHPSGSIGCGAGEAILRRLTHSTDLVAETSSFACVECYRVVTTSSICVLTVKESTAITPSRPNAATNANITIAAFVFILILRREQIIQGLCEKDLKKGRFQRKARDITIFNLKGAKS
jgi:hypothetical protein